MEISLKYVGKFSKFSSEIKKKNTNFKPNGHNKGGEKMVFLKSVLRNKWKLN